MRLLAVLACLLRAGPDAGAQGEDAFLREHAALVGRSPESDRFSIAFADGRRAFHPGETIELAFTFDRSSVNAHDYAHYPNLQSDEVHLDRTDGTADPTRDLDRSNIYVSGGVYGGVYGCSTSGCTPITLAVYLNQAVRFDTAGHYRFYVTSAHFLGVDALCASPVVSNVLELEILPPDDAWDARAASAASEVLRTSADEEARDAAARTLSYLASNAAADVMLDRYLRGRADATVTQHFASSFFAARDRAHVIERLATLLDDPARQVSYDLPRMLAALSLGQRGALTPFPTSGFMAELRTYSHRRARALRRAGRLGQALDSELARFSTDETVGVLGLTAGFADVPRDVERAFWRLPAAARRQALLNVRHAFSDPVFVPFLERVLLAGGDEGGPPDVAAWLLRDMAPDRLRDGMLADLQSAHPRLPIGALRLLSERELPQLDPTFARQLRAATTRADAARALDFIERFGTARIATDVERTYVRQPGARSDCRLAIPALAYFFRVDPEFARHELRRVRRTLSARDTACGRYRTEGLFPSVAARRASPALEDAALSALDGTDAAMTADAAMMLQRYGSPRAEAPLWRALELWHARSRDRPAPSDDGLDEMLMDAMWRAVAWRIDDAGFDRLSALCLSPSCRERVAHERVERKQLGRNSLYIGGRDPETGESRFLVEFNTIDSLAALEQKIAQYPAGTTFVWSGRNGVRFSDPVDFARDLDGVTAVLHRHGMSIVEQSRATICQAYAPR